MFNKLPGLKSMLKSDGHDVYTSKASIYTFSGLLAHLKMADPRGPPGPLNPVAVSVAACLELGCIVVYLFGDIPNALYLQHYDASHYTSFTDTT